ncbi:MAG: DHH family phosphoesterase, partial [Armatimonadetes bacterium]|nr:DHH family phosphoesterase [Armatimonadota bacterium]
MITVDNGISNFSQVKLIKELGIKIIITDHHEVLEEIPQADAVINPKRKECLYPHKNLSGAGVAFKLIQALFKNLNKD